MARRHGQPAPGVGLDPATGACLQQQWPPSTARLPPRVFPDEGRALFMLQALTKASDAQDARVASTKLKDYDIES